MGGEGREGEALCLPIRGIQRKPFMLAHTEWRGSGESYILVSATVINHVLIYSPFFFHLPTHFSKYWVPTAQRKDTRIMENKPSRRSPQRLLSNRIPPKGKQADVRFGGAVPVMGSGPRIIKEPADK